MSTDIALLLERRYGSQIRATNMQNYFGLTTNWTTYTRVLQHIFHLLALVCLKLSRVYGSDIEVLIS
jgi:hypothetical protein